MDWTYKREERQFDVIPEGAHRIRIASAEKVKSQNGRDMIAFQFDVSGSTQTLYHYIVFLPDRPEITNRQLTQFFDSFKDIPDGDFNTQNWVGKVGACMVKHEEYNGQTKARVQYFISGKRQDELPAWQEGRAVTGANGFVPVDSNIDVNVPF